MIEESLRFEWSGRRWIRYGLQALFAVLVLFSVVAAVVDHRWEPLATAGSGLLSWAAFWTGVRTRTVVTRELITVQLGFRQRRIPTSRVEEITQRAVWSPVIARLGPDETVPLPRVKAQDLAAIKRLIQRDPAE